MKRSEHASRQLAPELDRRLGSYALAATSAGVGMLALAMPAGAEIVYTPASQVIGRKQSFNLDLNQDGITDFVLSNRFGGGGCSTETGCSAYFAWLSARPAPGNGAEGFVIDFWKFPFALKNGAHIGRHRYFNGTAMAVVYEYPGSPAYQFGSWINVKNRYLGLKFKIGGKTHYGWARLSVKVNELHITATLTGYAYETIPRKSIKAGQTAEAAEGPEAVDMKEDGHVRSANTPSGESVPPASLGDLALGALHRGPRQ